MVFVILGVVMKQNFFHHHNTINRAELEAKYFPK